MNNKPAWEKKQLLKQRANQLRKTLTPQEKLLWANIRRQKLGGFYFRRQHVLGLFITDFCCVKARVVVELEGSVHLKQKEYDHHRAEWITDQGFTVLRFTNDQVEKNLEFVLEKILGACLAGMNPPSIQTD